MNFQEIILKSMLFCSVNINRRGFGLVFCCCFGLVLSNGTDFLRGGREGQRRNIPKPLEWIPEKMCTFSG